MGSVSSPGDPQRPAGHQARRALDEGDGGLPGGLPAERPSGPRRPRGRLTGARSFRSRWSGRPWYRAVLLAVALVLLITLVLVRCTGGADTAGDAATSTAPTTAAASDSADAGSSADASVGASDAPLPAAISGNPTTATAIVNGVGLDVSRDDGGYWHTNIASTGQWQVAGMDVAPSRQTTTVHRYAIQVEEGLPVDVTATATQISSILNDERGWTGYEGNSFQLVSDPGQAEFTIYLASSGTVDDLCAPDDTQGLVDCRNGNKVALNIDRWLFAAPPYAGQTVDAYRTYVVNHEVGHYIGFGHVPCPGEGQPAPIMLQQTIDLHGCVPAWWPSEVGYD